MHKIGVGLVAMLLAICSHGRAERRKSGQGTSGLPKVQANVLTSQLGRIVNHKLRHEITTSLPKDDIDRASWIVSGLLGKHSDIAANPNPTVEDCGVFKDSMLMFAK